MKHEGSIGAELRRTKEGHWWSRENWRHMHFGLFLGSQWGIAWRHIPGRQATHGIVPRFGFSRWRA